MNLSVVVPAYNAARYIGEALASVFSQLPPNSEVIVVDDGSTDDTASIAEGLGAHVIRESHAGIGTTMNRGMRAARGAFIASIDADDRWLPGKLEQQFAALDAEPAVDMVFGHVRQFVSPEIEDGSRFAISGAPMPGLHRGAMLIRRASWERVGAMETELTLGEFIGWYARAMDADLKMKMLPDVIYERRVHGSNTVIRERDAYGDYLRVVKATIDRRRARQREQSS